MSFWRRAFVYQKEKVAPWIALRNTVGFALPLAAGIAVGELPAALIAAIGALNVSYSDSHDPYVQRGRRMLAACALVGLAVFAGAICGNHPALSVPLVGGWAFAAGMLVALSTTAADLGIMSLVTVVVFAAKPLPPQSAALSGLLAMGGGLLQAGLALIFWPMRRYMPERRALSSLYLELAQAAVAAPAVREAPPASKQSTDAQTALANLAGDHSVEGERYRFLLSQAERMRLSLFALGRVRMRMARDIALAAQETLLARYLEMAAQVLRGVGAALVSKNPMDPADEPLERLDALAEEMRAAGDAGHDAQVQMDALNGQLRSACDLAVNSMGPGLMEFARQEVARPWHLRLIGTMATLRANLSLRSAACRHAIRLAVCVALGDAVGKGFELHRSYWLPMTVAIVLKPDFASTFTRGVLRLAGTFAGLILATGLFHLLPASTVVQAAVVVLLMYAMRCWGPANYGIFVTAVTGMIVLLIAMAGVAPKGVMVARGINTAIGGGIALTAYWLWPTRERASVQDLMALMLDAYRAYFRSIAGQYLRPEASPAAELDRVRVAGRQARSNVEASFDRLRGDPGTKAQTMAGLSAILASSHRMIHAMMALEAGLLGGRNGPAGDPFRRFGNHVELTLHSLAGALRGSPLTLADLPNLREDHHALSQVEAGAARDAFLVVETDRLTNSLNTLSEELVHWLETEKSGLMGVGGHLLFESGQ